MFAWFANTYNYSTVATGGTSTAGLRGLLIRIITQPIEVYFNEKPVCVVC